MENKKNKLELSFIEEGRLNIEEMNKINGGYVKCGQYGNGHCHQYYNCNWFLNKDYCGHFTAVHLSY